MSRIKVEQIKGGMIKMRRQPFDIPFGPPMSATKLLRVWIARDDRPDFFHELPQQFGKKANARKAARAMLAMPADQMEQEIDRLWWDIHEAKKAALYHGHIVTEEQARLSELLFYWRFFQHIPRHREPDYVLGRWTPDVLPKLA